MVGWNDSACLAVHKKWNGSFFNELTQFDFGFRPVRSRTGKYNRVFGVAETMRNGNDRVRIGAGAVPVLGCCWWHETLEFLNLRQLNIERQININGARSG